MCRAGHDHAGQKIPPTINFTEKIKNAINRSILNGFSIFQRLRNRCGEPVTRMSVKKKLLVPQFHGKNKNAVKGPIFNGFLIFQCPRNRWAWPVMTMSVKKFLASSISRKKLKMLHTGPFSTDFRFFNVHVTVGSGRSHPCRSKISQGPQFHGKRLSNTVNS